MEPQVFEEAQYRDCPWCHTRNVAMIPQWSGATVPAGSRPARAWSLLSCPRCGGATLLEVVSTTGRIQFGQGGTIAGSTYVRVKQQLPESADSQFEISHLPADVRSFFRDAIIVLSAGVPDAAAVQLRKTLEAAVAHKGVKEKTLVGSIRKLISEGAVTRDFGDVLHYVRKLGNLGAHFTDERLTVEDVERALRFTAQLLRNLFEVPGELAELARADEPAEEPGEVGAIEAIDQYDPPAISSTLHEVASFSNQTS